MKVLRIKWCNLNSLYGQDEVDLESALGGTSLFLVHGPTGSGKSTLTDAVSLALFGKTPRLDHAKGDGTRDPRAIMSRGEGRCFSEVEFSKLEAGGRRQYRARWTCWRARDKPDGALQTAERSLECLEARGEWTTLVSSRKVKEVEGVFEQVLEGFGVQDFNRSMLLAQGQFDAFLGAKAKERAEILERLTDTSVYQRLGERAYKMAKRLNSWLGQLRALANVGGVLDEQALVALKALHEAHALAKGRRVSEKSTAQGHLDWFNKEVDGQAQVDEAVEQKRGVEARASDAAESLTALAEHERCAAVGAFERLDAHGRAVQAREQLAESLSELREKVPGQQEAVVKQTGRLGVAREADKVARRWRGGLRPQVEAAERAAIALNNAQTRVDEAAGEHSEALALVRKGEAARGEAATSLEEAKGKAEGAQRDLDEHSADAALAGGWDALRSRLDRVVVWQERLVKERAGLDQRAAKLNADQGALNRELLEHTEGRDRLIGPLQAALESAKDELAKSLAGGEFGVVRKQRTDAVIALTKVRDRVRDAMGPVRAAREGSATLEDAAHRMVTLGTQLENDEQARSGLVDAVEGEQRRVVEAREALEGTQRVAAVAVHRVALVEGAECPLCGAVEHPWSGDPARAQADAVIEGTLAAAKRRVISAEAALKKRQEAERQAAKQVQTRRAELSLLRKQHQQATARQLGLDGESASRLEAADLPPSASAEAVEEALQRTEDEVLRATELFQRLIDAKSAVSHAREAKEAQAESIREIAEGLERRRVQLEERRGQLSEANNSLDEQATGLRSEVERCRVELNDQQVPAEGENAAAWRNAGDLRVRAHRARVERKAESDGLVSVAVAALEGKLGEVELLVEREGRVLAKLKKLSTSRDLASEEAGKTLRAFDEGWGQAVDACRKEPGGEAPRIDESPRTRFQRLEEWVEVAASHLKKSESDYDAAEKVLGATNEQIKVWVGQQEGVQGDLVAARSGLDEALMALKLSADSELATRRMAHDVLVVVRELRDGLTSAATAVNALIEERQRLLASHREERPESLSSDPSREALLGLLSQADTDLQVATDAHQGTGDALRDHHKAVASRRESLNRLREAEAEAEVWLHLHELIGKSDGRKFKEFAQALNLGQLLRKANAHLATLSDRYQLIPRLDGGLPTLEFDLSDLWQVGSRVAPRSLSGGERFLVSLALALGLSDFRAVKMPIETLLLDEGFGTLDQDTLTVALAALSQLQADGRQVGIISHVRGLQDQIQARIEVRPLGGGRSKVVVPGS